MQYVIYAGFVDDIKFSLTGHDMMYGEAYGRWMSVSERQRREGRSFGASAPPLSALPSAD